MPELNDFYNEGFGWICRHCAREFARTSSHSGHERETGGKEPELENRALAKWTDKTRRFLTCPRCGITEAAELS